MQNIKTFDNSLPTQKRLPHLISLYAPFTAAEHEDVCHFCTERAEKERKIFSKAASHAMDDPRNGINVLIFFVKKQWCL